MIKNEVGPQPEIGESRAERIYILPKVGRDKSDGFGIFILADGNNRSKVANQTDYDDGGRNVIRIAEALAERGDVSIMVGSILSPQNIAKRSDRFFYEMYIAFIGLGTRIEAEGTLVKSNIRLEVHGDLDALRARGGYAVKLANMMETVCAKTAHLENPRLRLILGVNYDEDSALDLGCDMIFRSGMESEQALRLSGTRSCEAIYAYGSTKLWPEVTSDDINGVVNDVKKRSTDVFQLGYSIEFMLNFLRAQIKVPIEEPFNATLAICGSEHEIRSALVDFFSRNADSANMLHITVESKKGSMLAEFGDTKSDKEINIILGSRAHMQSERPSSYSSILAPGQSEGPFKLPTIPEVGYANVQRCEATPEGITEGIRRAIAYNHAHVSLKGAERNIGSAGIESSSSPAEDIPEYAHFEYFKQEIAGMRELPSAVIAGNLSEDFPHNISPKYELTADVFTAKMMLWAEGISVPMHSAAQYRAFMNYVLTSFFICCRPDEADPKWEERAALSAKYMGAVYAGDENIFDIQIQDESSSQRKSRLDSAAKYLISSVDGNTQDPASPGLLMSIADNWRETASRYEGQCHPKMFAGWKKGIKELYRCSLNEYDPAVTSNASVDRLCSSPKDRTTVFKIRSVYAGAPRNLRERIDELMISIVENDPEINMAGTTAELRVILYLLDIYASIGTGLIYRTIGLTLEEDEINDGAIRVLDELCVLSDCYYRLLNDLAGALKSYESDSDTKEDSFSIAVDTYRKDLSEADAVLNGTLLLNRLKSWLQKQFADCRERLTLFNPYLGQVVKRSGIGYMVNKNAHYKDVSREQMMQFMHDFELELGQNPKNDK